MLKRISAVAEEKSRIILALGSNLAPETLAPSALIRRAFNAITGLLDENFESSAIFRSPSHPAGSGPDYANAVVCGRSSLDPEDILAELHRIEASFGRHRTSRWGARTLDLDLIACGDTILPDAATLRRWIDLPPAQQMREAPSELILPHPRLQDRAFVLVPMAQVAPDWRHPLLGRTVREMRDALPEADRAALVALD